MKRRTFLRRSAITAVGLGLASPLLGSRAFGRTRGAAGTAATDTVVVTLNLFGGNDGLNTVVPLAQYDTYRALRPTLALPREGLLALPGATDFGLNPGMTAMRDLYGQGKVAVVCGVGLPQDADGLFDHEASQYEFQAARVTEGTVSATPSGWVGRWLDTVNEGLVTPGVDFGGGTLVVTGERREALTISSIDEFRIQPGFDSDARLASYERIQAIPNTESAVAERSRLLRVQALDQSATVRDRTSGYVPMAQYPVFDDNYLAYELFQCAQLITADLGIRALSVGYDGYDTHANQNDGAGGGQLGYHDQRMKDVSDAIAAFYADLAAHGQADRVVLVVFSEFGRRPQENNDRGTDHGFGSVGFVVGGRVRGGVYGEYPGLADDRLVLDGNVDVTTDFRSVYSSILGDFLGTDPELVLGGRFAPLGIF